MINCVSYPNQFRNYCVFDNSRIENMKNMQSVQAVLDSPKDEGELLEALYT